MKSFSSRQRSSTPRMRNRRSRILWPIIAKSALPEVPRMSNVPLAGVQACVFDAYGTLFDFASAARGCRDVLGESIDKLTALWRGKQLQYTWLRGVQGRHADFWQVTGDALDFAFETFAVGNPPLPPPPKYPSLHPPLLRTLALCPGSPACSVPLKRAGSPPPTLATGPPAMRDAPSRAAGLGGLPHAVPPSGGAAFKKPHPKVYQLAVDRLGIPAAAI